MAIHFVDQEGGNDGNTGLSFAQRKKLLSAVTPSAGDTIKIMASPDPTSLGQTATWTNLSRTVTLNSAVTANISDCETNWTASANVTPTSSTTRKEGSFSQSLAIAAGFTTGVVAYFPLAGPTDFSGYQQVSFWIRTNATSIAAGVLEIHLCSDALGAVPVDVLAIPLLAANGQWQAVTINKGSALGNAIASVAINAASDPGTVTVLIDNIIACKAAASADSMTLNSLISKNNAGADEMWHAIKSINGTAVIIDNDVNSGAGSGGTYYGTTETVTTYIREPVKTIPSTAASVGIIQAAGTGTAKITVSGGWSRVDMATQTAETWWTGQNGLGVGVDCVNRQHIDISKFNFVRYNQGFGEAGSSGGNCTFTDMQASNMSNVGFVANSPNYIFTRVKTGHNASHGCSLTNRWVVLDDVVSKSNTLVGYSFSNSQGWGRSCRGYNNGSYALGLSNSEIKIYGFTSASNPTGGIFNTGYNAYLVNASIAESTEVGGMVTGQNAKVFLHNLDATTDNHRIYMDGGVVTSETGADRRTASGMAWELSPTSADRTSQYPVPLKLTTFAFVANSLVTVKAWFKRSNSAVSGRLFCRGAQIAGVATDVSSVAAGAAGTYEELTITFTPTEAGAVEIEGHAWGGTTHSVWIDDMTISQA